MGFNSAFKGLMHVVCCVFHMILTIKNEYFPMQHYIVGLRSNSVGCELNFCVLCGRT